MNLIINRECSNSCPYCFETAERRDGKQGLISIADATKFANWARNARLGYLSLLGGEPFLHPQLAEIVKLFRQTCPGTALRILTGGIFNKNLLNAISPQDVTLLFNINESRDYRNPKHFDKVKNNIDLSLRKGFKVTLGFNVWRSDFAPQFMPTLVHQFGLSKMAWTVANPIRECESKVVPTGEFGQLAEQCIVMLQEATRLNIEAVLDCPVPLCFFKDSDLAWVRQFHPETASGMGLCKPVLDVTPELEVIRCFALSNLTRVKVLDFRNENEIDEWFTKHLDTQLLDSGCYPQCNDCIHFTSGRCYGGCLAWHEGDIDTDPKSNVRLLETKMHKAIEAGKPSVALDAYMAANHWAKSDLATFAAAIAASQIGDWNQAFCYASDANYRAHNPEFMRLISDFITTIPVLNSKAPESPPVDDIFTRYVSCSSLRDDVPSTIKADLSE